MAEKRLAIYVSASPEMDVECELLGQLLADVPKSVKWSIKRTPGYHQHENPDIEGLRAGQFYVILLGMDITAPIGVEWLAARDAGLITFAFRKLDTTPSPAAAYFARDSGISWLPYHTPHGFVNRFERALITRLIEGSPGYGLDLADIEELSERLKRCEHEIERAEGEDRRGAGKGGVILPAG